MGSMDKLKSGIYQIVNTVNGKVYVGSAVNLGTRWQKHRYELKRQNHGNIHLQRAWNEYGADAFEFVVVEHVDDPNDLIVREQFWLDRHCAVIHGYNICRMAGSTLGREHSEETKAKIGDKSRGKVISEETRAKISAAGKGRKNSPEATEKTRAALVGRPFTEEHRANMRAAARKRVHVPHTEEAKARMSAAQKGHPVSDETRAKQSAAAKGKKKDLSSEAREARRERILGDKHRAGRKASDETKARLRASLKGRTGHKMSDEGKKAVAEANHNRVITDDTRAKISANMKRIWDERRAAKAAEKL